MKKVLSPATARRDFRHHDRCDWLLFVDTKGSYVSLSSRLLGLKLPIVPYLNICRSQEDTSGSNGR